VAQRDRLIKSRSQPIYLLDCQATTDDCCSCQFAVCGQTRNVYTVSSSSSRRGHGVDCDCPDMRTHCKKLGCVCKHICFVINRVAGLDVEKGLGADVHAALFDLASRYNFRDHGGENVGRLREAYLAIKKNGEAFAPTEDARECDDCPVCYDQIQRHSSTRDKEEAKVAMCPECHNLVHEACMRKWLEFNGRTSCVYCRSEVWSALTNNKNNNKKHNSYIRI
jgi:hypothetical protein